MFRNGCRVLAQLPLLWAATLMRCCSAQKLLPSSSDTALVCSWLLATPLLKNGDSWVILLSIQCYSCSWKYHKVTTSKGCMDQLSSFSQSPRTEWASSPPSIPSAYWKQLWSYTFHSPLLNSLSCRSEFAPFLNHQSHSLFTTKGLTVFSLESFPAAYLSWACASPMVRQFHSWIYA